MERVGGEVHFPGRTGVVLHQPLNLHIFRKNGDFRLKMNGPPVCPARKTENAPTWRSRSPLFRTRFLPIFMPFYTPPNPTLYPEIYFYLFKCISIYNSTPTHSFMPTLNSHPTYTSNPIPGKSTESLFLIIDRRVIVVSEC